MEQDFKMEKFYQRNAAWKEVPKNEDSKSFFQPYNN